MGVNNTCLEEWNLNLSTSKKCVVCGGVMHRQAYDVLVRNSYRNGERIRFITDEVEWERYKLAFLELESFKSENQRHVAWFCDGCEYCER